MVDVEQDSVEKPLGILRVESLSRRGEREEIAEDQTASRVGGELRPERNKAASVPADDILQRLDYEERSDSRMFERGYCGVTQTEATDNDIQLRRLQCCQSQICERDFDLMEEARHEECIAKFHLEDFQSIERPDSPAAQDQFAKRGLAVVEFGEVGVQIIRMRRSRTVSDIFPRFFLPRPLFTARRSLLLGGLSLGDSRTGSFG